MKIITLATLLGLLVFSHASIAHHSDAGIDDLSEITLEGTVTEFRWRQPHVFLAVDVVEDGQAVNWDIQLIALNILSRQGWSRDSLVPGDEVVVTANPGFDGKPYAKLLSIVRADGSPVTVSPDAPEISDIRTDSFTGIWTSRRPAGVTPPERAGAPEPQAPPAPLVNGVPCTTGFDCFFRANLVLTEAGQAAMDVYDPLSAENPESTCVGRPTPSALVSAGGYLLQFDASDIDEKLIIRSEWFNEERTVWMDGRGHPDPSVTLQTGHSIGYWEGDTLVVDTRNFDDHRSPYQIGVPSGSQKHVVEKYRLNEDGRSMYAEFTLADPQFIAAPFTNSKTLWYSPHLEFVGISCDIENTSRFLEIGE